MRTCPFCTASIPPERFACRKHWFDLTAEEQREINSAFHMYKSRFIGADVLRRRQQAVIDSAGARIKAKESGYREANGMEPKKAAATSPPVQPKCRSCQAPIFWATTEQGKTIPMDAQPVADGNMYRDGDVMKCISLINQPEAGAPLFKSHFATCANSAKHRKAGAK